MIKNDMSPKDFMIMGKLNTVIKSINEITDYIISALPPKTEEQMIYFKNIIIHRKAIETMRKSKAKKKVENLKAHL